MTAHKYALPEPTTVIGSEDGQTLELARLWVHRGEPAILVRPAYDDPKAMGEMLAELSWHVAYAYEQKGGHTQAQALEALKSGWRQGHINGEQAAQKRAVQ